MYKTLRISLRLKNAYRVNIILFSLKQIPLIKKLLPQSLYKSKGLKSFANILSLLWGIVSLFGIKLLYYFAAVCGVEALYESLPTEAVFLHILLLFSVIGSFANTKLFNPTRDKLYAMKLMRMDARQYTLSSYVFYCLKFVLGSLPFTIIFGLSKGVPLWLCILLPFCIVGMKSFFVGLRLWKYEKKSVGYNEDKLSGSQWALIGILLAAAYGLPSVGFAIPTAISTGLFLLGMALGIVGFVKILGFKEYRAINSELLSELSGIIASADQLTKQAAEKRISADPGISSNQKGFEFLNELFIRRHRKMLWKATRTITYVCLFLIAGMQLLLYLMPEIKTVINEGLMLCLPYFLFVMYCINRGTSFTQALFMNCDHSLLTYAFYKKPNFILKLFGIRLREIMKINAVPALVIGVGLALTLYTSGGTDNPLNYAVLIVSILCMSLFFSVHYLTMYYLLQPYSVGTEMKSGTYSIVSTATYFVCYFFTLHPVKSASFGILTIAFVIVYCIAACLLVFYLAPKTFRLRL